MSTEIHHHQDKSRVIGVDLGKTKIAVGLVAPDGTLDDRQEQPTNIAEGGPAILKHVAAMIEQVQQHTAHPIAALGIASTGLLDPVQGIALRSGSIPDFEGLDIAGFFERRCNLPTTVDNDVYAAALAEERFGAARTARTAVYLSLGTSIGAAMIKDGEIWRGSHGLAGQIGHLPLPGTVLCIGDLFGRHGIEHVFTQSTGQEASTSAIFQAAHQNEPHALYSINWALENTALLLAWLQQTLDPDVFVLGGGVALAQPSIIGELQARAHLTLKHYTVSLPRGMQVVPAALGRDSGVIGAAVLAWERARE